MKFEDLGVVVCTRNVDKFLKKNDLFGDFVLSCLVQRYGNDDWGEMCDEDKKANDSAVKNKDDRIFASYRLPDFLVRETGEEELWIITEWDRSYTTLLFPSEY